MRRFRGHRGAAGQQYAIVVGLIAVVAILGVTSMGGGVRTLMTRIGNTLGTVSGVGGAAGGSGGGSVAVAHLSCGDVKTQNPTATDGAFPIDVDGAGPLPSYTLYCDMTSPGGPWTLIAKFSGADDGMNTYVDGTPNAGFNLVSLNTLSTSGTINNAKLPDAAILALVGNRTQSAVTFRMKSASHDTLIEATGAGKNPFAYAVTGDGYRCKQLTAGSWVNYTISSYWDTAAHWIRLTTFTSNIASGDPGGAQQCGQGLYFGIYDTAGPFNHGRQNYNVGAGGSANVAGVTFVN